VQLVLTKHIPWQLVERYRRASMRRAKHRQLEDGSWYAEIPGFEGVWASEETLQDCLNVLDEVLLDWLLLKIEHEDRDIPVVEGIDLNVL
jgi:predicted RNase H-like HicB family nuclease